MNAQTAAEAAAAAAAELELEDPELRAANRKRRIVEAKLKLASTAEAILENPEEQVCVGMYFDVHACMLSISEAIRRVQFLLFCSYWSHSVTVFHAHTCHASKLLRDLQVHLLDEFAQLCLDADPIIRQLAYLASVEVFKDILPGYRIRLPTQQELATTV
jgi:hypothetical protein